MKIHGVCLAKNEADIIGQTLEAAVQWCDFIYVMDNGSTDGTWEIVQELSRKHSNIVPYKQYHGTYHNYLRGEVFRRFEDNAEEGDWWCGRLDADEFYIDDPREFLANVPTRYQSVWSESYTFYFTDKDLEDYERDPALFADDRPAAQKMLYYLNDWSEGRFFRYRKGMIWPEKRGWPICGAVSPQRIRQRHYRWRSPEQMQSRVKVRLEAKNAGCESFRHVARAYREGGQGHGVSSGAPNVAHEQFIITDDLWKTYLTDAADLDFAVDGEALKRRPDLMPDPPAPPVPLAWVRAYLLTAYYKAREALGK